MHSVISFVRYPLFVLRNMVYSFNENCGYNTIALILLASCYAATPGSSQLYSILGMSHDTIQSSHSQRLKIADKLINILRPGIVIFITGQPVLSLSFTFPLSI